MRKLLSVVVIMLGVIFSGIAGADSTLLIERLQQEDMLIPEPNILFKHAGDKQENTQPPVPLLTSSAPVAQPKNTAVSESQTELSELKRKLSSTQRELQALRKQNQSLKSRQPAVLTEQTEAFSDENKQLYQQLLASEKQLAENARRHEKQVVELTARAEELQSQMTHIQLAANEATSQKALLEQQLAKQSGGDKALTAQLEDAGKQISEQLSQLNVAKNTIAGQLARLSELEQQVKKADEEKMQALDSLATLQKQHDVTTLKLDKVKQPAYSLKAHKSEEANVNYAYGAYYAVNVLNESKMIENAGYAFLPQAFQQGLKDKMGKTMQLTEEDVRRNLSRLDQKLSEVASRENGHNKKQSAQFVAQAAKVKGAEQVQNGVVYLVIKKGKTPVLTANDTIRFRLDEKISTGKKISAGEVRIGLVNKLPELMQQGVQRIGSGGKIRITVPSELAYGEQGIPGTVPPGVASEITIEILGIVK